MLTPEELRPFNTLPPRILETERLKLRALEESDARLIFELYANDAETSKYMSFKVTGNFKDTETFCTLAAKRFKGENTDINHYVWVIENKLTGEPMGSTGIGPRNEFTVDGGYILNPKFWGLGYASEAWGCVVQWAQSQPAVYRIQATHDVENIASGKVMQKAGMFFEGILRKYSLSPNVGELPRDVAIYAWVRNEL